MREATIYPRIKKENHICHTDLLVLINISIKSHDYYGSTKVAKCPNDIFNHTCHSSSALGKRHVKPFLKSCHLSLRLQGYIFRQLLGIKTDLKAYTYALTHIKLESFLSSLLVSHSVLILKMV